MSASAPQPPPVPNDQSHVVDLVIDDLRERKAMGIAKYGTALQPFNGRNALVDAYQESSDQTLYLRQALEEWGRVLRGLRLIAAYDYTHDYRVPDAAAYAAVKRSVNDLLEGKDLTEGWPR